MLRVLLPAVALVVIVVEGCDITGVASYGESCSCSDVCLGGSFCQRNGNGGWACLCPPCQEFNSDIGQCLPGSNTGDQCGGGCRGDLECLDNGDGTKSCQCRNGYVFDPETRKCSQACVNYNAEDCRGLPNGDYPACFPRCRQGIFITCSNNILYVRDCSLGWYVRPNGERFTSKLVYDPRMKRCERSAPYCPRPLDNNVEE